MPRDGARVRRCSRKASAKRSTIKCVRHPVTRALSLPKACSPRRVAGECSRTRKLSDFRIRPGDNHDLVFITSDSISIFLVTI